MQCDTVYGDNHWYIQDFPRLSDGAAYTETPFERLSQAGVFDFSAAKAYEYGQLRLRKVVCNLLKKRYREDKNKVPKMTFEICVGSVGHLENEGVVSNFLESCAGKSAGVDRRRTGAQNDIPYDARCESVEVRACCALHPPVSFPSVVSLRSPTRIAFVDPQGNISSHIDWNALEEKNAEYLKDHLALHRHSSNQKRRPMYMYLGSANFSSSAWGKVEREGRNRAIAAILRTERLEKVANFECGVVVRGEDTEGMLEPGSRWEDIVPYERPTEVNHYKDGERPWKMRKSDIEGPEPPIMDWDDADATMKTRTRTMRQKSVIVRLCSWFVSCEYGRSALDMQSCVGWDIDAFFVSCVRQQHGRCVSPKTWKKNQDERNVNRIEIISPDFDTCCSTTKSKTLVYGKSSLVGHLGATIGDDHRRPRSS
ncbi:hypothetical protein B0H13DRAFT_2563433 [Mycena leptocephala]|nr:hypothetical protein B0H13DRAFT_2563433 [Mycena leptocephala]